MFTANPWVAYLGIVSPLVALYYVAIGFKYYRADFKMLFSGKARLAPKLSAVLNRPDVTHNPGVSSGEPTNYLSPDVLYEEPLESQSWQNEELMIQLETLALRIKESLGEAMEKHYDKQELVLLLQMIIREYPLVKENDFQPAINGLIQSELEDHAMEPLTEEEHALIWNLQLE